MFAVESPAAGRRRCFVAAVALREPPENRTAAGVVRLLYLDAATKRRHPEPALRSISIELRIPGSELEFLGSFVRCVTSPVAGATCATPLVRADPDACIPAP